MRTLLNQLQRVETVLGLGGEGRDGDLVEVPGIPEGDLAAYKTMRAAWGDDLPEAELLELEGPVWLPEREARLAALCRRFMAEEGLKFLAYPERFALAMESIADAEARRSEEAERVAGAADGEG